MAIAQELKVMVLVKASPVLTSELDESMCVAGVTLDSDPRWVRLHPVPFRDLEDAEKFKKYQVLEVKVVRPTQDGRRESWKPIEGSIRLGPEIGPGAGWSRRSELIAPLGETTTCALREANLADPPSAPTLGIVRPAEPPRLKITQRPREQLERWKARAAAVGNQPSLLEEPSTSERKPLALVPWRFSYQYRCLEDGCTGHTGSLIDWEAFVLYGRIKGRPNWQDLMVERFEQQMWANNRGTRLFVGNMASRRQNFLTLGVYWPPGDSWQGSLWAEDL